MVFPALLRDAARDPQQAGRRDRHVRLDPVAVLPAVAGHEGPERAVPAGLQVVLLAADRVCFRAGLCRQSTAGRDLHSNRTSGDRLLLRPFPDRPALARPDRAATATARPPRRAGSAGYPVIAMVP